jgi:3-mercaptopyruvate sulfurtransferase SseA
MTQYFAATAAMLFAMSTSLVAQTVVETTLGDADQTTAEVSTRELQQIIRNGDAVLLDARPPLEYATSHIPGALVVAPQPRRAAHH